jgi:DNA-binding NtrC family response regulator
VLGTSTSCDVSLGDRQVSRRHVSFALEGTALLVTDLESKNGTFVGNARVHAAPLFGGEIVRVGETTIKIERGQLTRAELGQETRFGAMFATSREMRRLVPLLRRLADTTVPVILQGETGTGKEVLAESIHAESPLRDAPFLVFDPTSVRPELAQAELFGHTSGAFTGDLGERRGLVEQANGGTLLVDEVDTLPLELQARLLRMLERGEVRPVGSDHAVRVDVRLLVSTRRDLDREVQAGRFRDDLFHRLAVGRVELPPLRKRVDDIADLTAHFATELGGDASRIPLALVTSWREQPWPGNVRELRNAVARHIALGELSELAFADSSRTLAATPAGQGWLDAILEERLPLVEARAKTLAVFERRYVEFMLKVTNGNVARAAAHSGVARRYFQILKAKRGT